LEPFETFLSKGFFYGRRIAMRKSSLVRILGIALVVCAVADFAEAGASASKMYQLSVTIPAVYQVQARQTKSPVQKNDAQTVIVQDMRGDRLVSIKTVVAK